MLLLLLILLLAISLGSEISMLSYTILHVGILWDSDFTSGYPLWIFFIALPFMALSVTFIHIKRTHPASLLRKSWLSAIILTLASVVSIFGFTDVSHTGGMFLFYGMLIQYVTTAVAVSKYSVKLSILILASFAIYVLAGISIDNGAMPWALSPLIAVIVALGYYLSRPLLTLHESKNETLPQ
ncbi:MAG: hypothetical protein ACREHG_01055 [Candidatus Saccharimonadales bacterium]